MFPYVRLCNFWMYYHGECVERFIYLVCFWLQGGPYHNLLQGLLGAYACYRPDIGYVCTVIILSRLSFLAACSLSLDSVSAGHM